MEELTLAPNLSVSINWNWRMGEVLRKRYPDLWFSRPCADTQLCQEYENWQRRLRACYCHIQCFFKLTGSLPMVGDLLQVLEQEDDWKEPDLQIESRSLFACLGHNSVRVTYKVQSKWIEDMEAQLAKAEQEVVPA